MELQKGATRYRLLIAVFDEAQRMWRALAELLENGFSPQQFCIVGLPEAITRLQTSDAPYDSPVQGLDELLAANCMIVKLDNRLNFAARCGAQMSELFSAAASEDGGFGWMQDELRTKLAAHAAREDVIVLARVEDTVQHTLGAQVFLRHGRHALQTHEFFWGRD